MRGLKRCVSQVLVIAFTLGLAMSATGCSMSDSSTATCTDISSNKIRQGTSLAWNIGETQYLGYGTFECDVPSKVKVEIIEDSTGSYVFDDVVATFGADQAEFGNFHSQLKDNKEFFQAVKTIERDPGLSIEANERIQIFVGTKPTKNALLFGVERHTIKVTFYSLSGKSIGVFHPTNDIGTMAEVIKN